MNKAKLVITWFLAAFIIFTQFSLLSLAAESGTVLPKTEKGITSCKVLMNEVDKNSCWVKNVIFKGKSSKSADEATLAAKSCGGVKPDETILPTSSSINDVLGCGIKTGSIHLWMVPYYIRFILQFIIGISGLVSMGGIVYGGYLYLFAGVSNEKDQGKKAIMYSIIGMIMTLVAWAFVNIIIAFVTG